MLWGFAADLSSQSHYSQFISQWKRFAFIDMYQNIANRFVDAPIGGCLDYRTLFIIESRSWLDETIIPEKSWWLSP
ncbi:hypothetical protein EFU54_00395 [Vibrio cholerae]|nr:hypothetical protein [Vibrio cholerae]